MKTITKMMVVLTMLLCSIGLFAQSILVVEPGIGTLNAAIAQHQGNRIYELKAGEWYQLDGVIENVDYHLQIIGQKPVGSGMPATLQTGADAQGNTFGIMFNARGNITLKNIYFVNADLMGTTGRSFLQQLSTNGRTIVDNCIVDPVGIDFGIILTAANTKTYLTNSLWMRHGHQLNPNDAFFITSDNASGAGFDTLLVQNNTLVAMGTGLHAAGFNKYTHKFSKWDHNTIVLQKSQIDWSLYEREYYWTNNLMFDVQTQPWAVTWQPMPGADAGKPQPALIYADTIPEELASVKAGTPSTTIQNVQYNMHYRNPGFYTLLTKLNTIGKQNGKAELYYMPLLYGEEMMSTSRETQLFANNTMFPYWKYSNTLTDIDPQWEDTRIYTQSNNFVEWTDPASQIHALGLPSGNYPAASQWKQWHWDLDGDPSINEAWPAFNGKYTNPQLLTASIEGLPLGDLNWFPEAKAKWLANKAQIDAHLKATNEEKIVFTSIYSPVADRFALKAYPNPFNSSATISYSLDQAEVVSLTITNMIGQTVKTFAPSTRSAGTHSLVWDGNDDSGNSLVNGIYFYTLRVGTTASTQRLVMVK